MRRREGRRPGESASLRPSLFVARADLGFICRSTLSEEEQKVSHLNFYLARPSLADVGLSLQTQLSTLLQSVSSYIDFPSKYTEPTDLGSAMFHISPVVLLDSLCVELERSLELLRSVLFSLSFI